MSSLSRGRRELSQQCNICLLLSHCLPLSHRLVLSHSLSLHSSLTNMTQRAPLLLTNRQRNIYIHTQGNLGLVQRKHYYEREYGESVKNQFGETITVIEAAASRDNNKISIMRYTLEAPTVEKLEHFKWKLRRKENNTFLDYEGNCMQVYRWKFLLDSNYIYPPPSSHSDISTPIYTAAEQPLDISQTTTTTPSPLINHFEHRSHLEQLPNNGGKIGGHSVEFKAK
jgi:hypothetical protein